MNSFRSKEILSQRRDEEEFSHFNKKLNNRGRFRNVKIQRKFKRLNNKFKVTFKVTLVES